MAGDVDLILSELLNTGSPVNLVLGGAEATPSEGALLASVAPRARMVGKTTRVVRGHLVAAVGPRAFLSGQAVERKTRTLSAQAGGAWQDAVPGAAQAGGGWIEASQLSAQAATPWTDAVPRPCTVIAAWSASERVSRQAATAWTGGTRVAGQAAAMWQETTRRRVELQDSRWQAATLGPLVQIDGRWQAMTVRAIQQLAQWGEAAAAAVMLTAGWGLGAPRDIDGRSPWQRGSYPGPGKSTRPPRPPDPEPHTCYTPPPGRAVVITLAQLANFNDTRLILECEGHAGGGIVVPSKRTYIVQNNVSLIRVSDGASVPVQGMTLAVDVDSWTWGFSAALHPDALPLVSSGAEPIELEARINGAAYRVLVESLASDRTFGQTSIRIQGRGRAAVLDAPFSPVLNFGNPSADRLAQQLAGDALDLTGWSVAWGLEDWMVPAGAWSFQGTRIGALSTIAAAAGAYLQPHPTADVMRVLHRYPTAPWAWADVTPDIVLPADVMQREGITWSSKARYNRVYVSGSKAGAGVLGRITRNGTAGDLLAPMVTDALATAPAAVRQRGRAILSDTGQQALVSLRLPVLLETGVVLPGTFVSYEDGATVRKGLVRSTSVEAGFPEVWQTIGVETHV